MVERTKTTGKIISIIILITVVLLFFFLFNRYQQNLNSSNQLQNNSKLEKDTKNKNKNPISNLKSLQIDQVKLGEQPQDQKKKTDSSKKLGERKTSFKLLPGPEIIDQYDRNDGDIKKTFNDFKDKPSVQAEVTVPF